MPNTYGLSSVVFGTPTLTGFVIQSSNVSNKDSVSAMVHDENGVVVHRRYDDLTSEISIEAVFNGATIPVPGATFTYNAIEYICEASDIKSDNKGFKTVTLKGLTSQGITLS